MKFHKLSLHHQEVPRLRGGPETWDDCLVCLIVHHDMAMGATNAADLSEIAVFGTTYNRTDEPLRIFLSVSVILKQL